MNVVWTRRAIERLDEIEGFIAGDNPENVKAFVERLIARGGSLSDFHARGRVVPELSNPSIRELLVDNYRIVYRCDFNRIVILTVFEAHRSLRPDEIR